MPEANHQPSYNLQPQQRYGQHQNQNQHYAVKAVTAVTTGCSLLVLSGLILAGTVIALTIATPLFVIFSQVLVPAVITVALMSLGFLASGGFGVAALRVLAWIYRYVDGEQPAGAEQLDKVMNKAKEMKDMESSKSVEHSVLTLRAPACSGSLLTSFGITELIVSFCDI